MGVMNNIMKRILLFNIFLVLLVFTYNANSPYVFADSNNTNYVKKLKQENRKLKNENNKLKKQNKQGENLTSIASSLVAPIITSILVPFISLFFINTYRNSEIIDFERPLLDFKTRAQISITNTFTVMITLIIITVIFEIVLLIKHPYWFWSIEVFVIIICIWMLYSLDKAPSKHALVFELHKDSRDPQYYTIIHKFDDTFFLGKMVTPIQNKIDSYEEKNLYKLFNKDSLVNIDAHVGKVIRHKKDLKNDKRD